MVPNADAAGTMAELFARTVRNHGARPAIVDPTGTVSWSAFGDRVARAVAVLNRLGIGAGERFALLGRNSSRQAELFQAAYCSGAIAVPLNYRLASAEVLAVIEEAGCRALFFDTEFENLMPSAALPTARIRRVRLDAGAHADGAPRYDELILDEPVSPQAGARIHPHTPALLLHTSGTSRRAKGVLLTHGNLAAVATEVAQVMGARAEDRYLHIAPMFHSADLAANAYTAAGASHGYLTDPKPADILAVIERLRVTVTILPPTLLKAVLEVQDFPRYDLSSLRQILFGAAPFDPVWVERTLAQLPWIELWHGYGLTETAQMLTLFQVPREGPVATRARRLRSCGRALPSTELRIVDDGGRDCGVDVAGEVWARGPQIAAGYLANPEATAQAFCDGWFRTGDIGERDAEGYLTLLDRKKDMVITGGENVYTLEVETVLMRHPSVADVAVVGVPDATYGEALVAVVVPRAGSMPQPEALIEHCRAYIGGYKIPRRYRFCDALPRSALGKVLKQRLRAEVHLQDGATIGRTMHDS